MIRWMCVFLLIAGSDSSGRTVSDETVRRLDRNHDGRISLEEFYPTGPAPLHPRMKQVFDSLDTEASGTLSFKDTAKAIETVRGNLPKFSPDLAGTLNPVHLKVHPGTKRAFVSARVNGVTGVFLLDTGTSDTIITPDFAKRAKVDFVEICMRITAGNVGPIGDFVSLVRVPDLEMGDLHFRDFHAIVRESKLSTYEIGSSIDGVLGANLIFAKPITIDIRNQCLTFTDAPPPQFDYELSLSGDDKTAIVDADIDGLKVPLLFDSGAALNGALLINEPHHEAIRKLANDPEARTYIAKEVRACGQVLDADKRCLLRPFQRSVIDSVFFDRHVIHVDTAQQKVWVKRNPPEQP